ncbi:hypothetical protein E2C01_100410 [Portunus trituberculatus]|uniref:Secreted protein n=1 Tax=Portunus trituberculatus TaxID=210409 RepID=A0A5B7KDH4_PORTR|nr:hypothetical protein [Portunus trituberculatus]
MSDLLILGCGVLFLVVFSVSHAMGTVTAKACVRSRQCPRYRLEEDILQLANWQFISLGSPRLNSCTARRTVLVRHPMLLWPLALQLSLPVRRQLLLPLALLGRVFLFIRLIVDDHMPPISPKPLKGLTKRHRGSAESTDLAQSKQSKVSPGVHDRDFSRDRSAMVAPVVSLQPFCDALRLRSGFL